MAHKTVDIEVSAIYSFTYDPESPEFKETLEAYKNVIDQHGGEEALLVYVADNLRQNGGVALGIAVEEANPDFNYEIL